MHAGHGRWARRPAATPPQIIIAIVVTAAVTAFCALYLMKSYTDQMTREMAIALREAGAGDRQRSGCTLSYASAGPGLRPVHRRGPARGI